jgi:hypothetical protein
MPFFRSKSPVAIASRSRSQSQGPQPSVPPIRASKNRSWFTEALKRLNGSPPLSAADKNEIKDETHFRWGEVQGKIGSLIREKTTLRPNLIGRVRQFLSVGIGILGFGFGVIDGHLANEITTWAALGLGAGVAGFFDVAWQYQEKLWRKVDVDDELTELQSEIPVLYEISQKV